MHRLQLGGHITPTGLIQAYTQPMRGLKANTHSLTHLQSVLNVIVLIVSKGSYTNLRGQTLLSLAGFVLELE